MGDGDDALAIVRWLGVAPETFVRPERQSPIPEYMPRGTAWRIGGVALHAALDAARIERGTTWTAIARELGSGITTGALSRLAGRGAGVHSPPGCRGSVAERADRGIHAGA